MNKVKLYKEYTERQLISLIKKDGGDFHSLKLVEYSFEEVFGDFLFYNEYGFKKIYSKYQCLITPTESHKKRTFNTPRASGDRSSSYYTRYKNKAGGKESFNPVTKAGGVENINTTKRKFGI